MGRELEINSNSYTEKCDFGTTLKMHVAPQVWFGAARAIPYREILAKVDPTPWSPEADYLSGSPFVFSSGL